MCAYTGTNGEKVLNSIGKSTVAVVSIILALEGKPLLLVTETEERFKLQAAWMKTLRDQSSQSECRTLYRDPVKFCPSWMISMSTNVQLQWSTLDGGVLRSYCGVPWPITFGPVANAAENLRVGDPELKTPEFAKKMAPPVLLHPAGSQPRVLP